MKVRPVLGLDIETVSAADLPAVGADAYAAHESTRVYCAALVLLDDYAPARQTVWRPGADLPPWAVDHIAAGGIVCAHNAAFERSICSRILHRAHDWPAIRVDQWLDTASIARLFSLPGSLGQLGLALGCGTLKDDAGKALMLSMCRASLSACRTRYDYPRMTADQREQLEQYCLRDVLAMLEILQRLPLPTLAELETMRVDARINARGFAVDLEWIAAIRRACESEKERLAGEMLRVTGDLYSTTNVPALAAWVESRGVAIPTARRKNADGALVMRETMDRGALTGLLAGELPDDVRAALATRLEAGRATSLAKVNTAARMAVDGVVRDVLQYCGSHTGRWSSSGVQAHNMPRVPEGRDFAAFRRHIEAGDYDAARRIMPGLEGLSLSLRSIIVPRAGSVFYGADYSAIEARVLAWLAGEPAVLDAFRAGRDIYTEDAKAVGSADRQFGKVQRLALGYGMGDYLFWETAQAPPYNIKGLTLKEARRIRRAWHANNPAIVAFWWNLENAFIDAIKEHGRLVQVGQVGVIGTPHAVRLLLPSGRALHYWRPGTRWETRRFNVVDEEGTVTIKQKDTLSATYYRSRRGVMAEETTYGGELAENVTQAVSRDVLAHALCRLERDPAAVYSPVLHVHDSIVAECAEGNGSVAEFVQLVTELPAWAHGLPIAAKGYRAGHFCG